MVEITINETPSSPINTNGLVYVTDSKGRKLGLRRLPFLEEFKIMEAVGPDLASNTTYMGMLNPLLYLAEIDGMEVPIPRTKLAIDGLIQRAGREGFMAVIEGITKYFAIDQQEMENRIKNGDSIPA